MSTAWQLTRRLARIGICLWLILLVAAGLRLGYGWSEIRQVRPEMLPVHFQQETGNIAYSLAAGKGFSSPYGQETGPTAWLTPVYPVLVAGIFRVFGIGSVHAFYATVLMNMMFSAATCVPIFYAGKHLAGDGVAAGAAWAWALLPNAIILPFQWIWDTSLTALCVALLLWATLCVAESGRWRDWCGYGLLWGFALMVNPAPGALLPFWLAWLAYRAYRGDPQDFARTFWKPALGLAIAILCCLPWTIRNYRAFHEWIPLRSNFGLELYFGNNENYDDVHPRVWPNTITREKEINRFFKMGEMPFMHEEMHKALDFIVAHPRVEVRLTAGRIVEFWMGTATPYRDFLRADSFLLQAVSVSSLLLVIGTFGGIVVLYRQRSKYTFPLAVCPIVFPLLYYATHGSLRYRHPLDPAMVLLSAIAVAAALERFAAAKGNSRSQAAS